MCTRPIRINGFTLPCGKCPECLKAQELTLGFYGLANATKYTSVASITLSYDDEHIPLVSNTLVIAHNSKTYRSLYDYQIISPERDLCAYSADNDSLRSIWLNRDKSKGFVQLFSPDSNIQIDTFNTNHIKGYTHDGILDFNTYRSLDCEFVHLLHPIGLVEHLQSWFKKLREYHLRMFGYKPDICYTAVMEYGPSTGRPHFHVCMFFNHSMSERFLHCMCFPDTFKVDSTVDGCEHELTGWPYGSINKCTVHEIASLGKDGKPHYQDALHFAKYVAKYGKKSDKGKNFIEFARLVPPSRRLTSKGFTQSAQDICNSIILKDIPRELLHVDPSEMYDRLDELLPYAEMIKERMLQKYTILPNCKPQKIPNDVLLRCLGYTTTKTLYGYAIYNPEKEIPIRKVTTASALYLATKMLERGDNLTDSVRAFTEFAKQYSGTDKTLSQIIVLFQSHLFSLATAREGSIGFSDHYTEPMSY